MAAVEVLRFSPFTCRTALGNNRSLRELLIPFGSAGYVPLFEIESRSQTCQGRVCNCRRPRIPHLNRFFLLAYICLSAIERYSDKVKSDEGWHCTIPALNEIR